MNPVRTGEGASVAGTPAWAEETLQRELRRGERRRAGVMLALLGLLAVVVVAIRLVPGLIQGTLRQPLLEMVWPILGMLGAAMAYMGWVRAWLGRLERADRPVPTAFRYVNTLVEVSLPTVAIVLGARAVGGLPSLAGAAPLVYFLFVALAALTLDARLCLFAGTVAAGEYAVVSTILLASAGPGDAGDSPVVAILTSPHQVLLRCVFVLGGGVVAAYIARQIRHELARVVATAEERDRAVSIFGQHVSPQVAELLLRQRIDFAGQERNVCVMFLDIRDFSRLANERDAVEVMDYLNVLFGFMIPVVNGHHGIVNKFLGDGFMAVFGAPANDAELCRHAVHAAREILQRLEALNRDGRIPPTRVGIGLHVGRAVTGNVGTTERKEYTIIGDVVNLAARIEQATKPLAARLLVSEAVLQAIPAPERAGAEDLGPIELKGQSQSVRLFRLA